MTYEVKLGGKDVAEVIFSNDKPFSLLCGPCALETRDIAMTAAESITNTCQKLNISVVFKSSFDKANRTSVKGDRGMGIQEGLKLLQEIRTTFKVPVVTDIHESHQASTVAEVADVLQIPAFLCRQTDLLLAAAATGKVVNVKKGQFLSPQEMANVATKVAEGNNKNILLTERGSSFGYNNLVVDMRGLRIMGETGYPVVLDATHSVQAPGGNGISSGGKREFVEPLSRAAAAVGVAGFFMEAHPNPSQAISDAANQIPLDKLEGLLTSLKAIDEVAKANPYQGIQSDA
jgi:2-dehydro-3-deoxyphosphooctonate aldolase (KDO 8-P synthase)